MFNDKEVLKQLCMHIYWMTCLKTWVNIVDDIFTSAATSATLRADQRSWRARFARVCFEFVYLVIIMKIHFSSSSFKVLRLTIVTNRNDSREKTWSVYTFCKQIINMPINILHDFVNIIFTEMGSVDPDTLLRQLVNNSERSRNTSLLNVWSASSGSMNRSGFRQRPSADYDLLETNNEQN